MPRKSRKNLIADDLTFHVYNRGNAKLDIFHDDRDYKQFLKIVYKYKQKNNLQIYHWVLMLNHYHFLLTIQNPQELTKSIGAIQQVYTQYHHLRWDSAGRLWQNRFQSQPVQKDGYLHKCGRYIERNPLRAKIVQHPWDYKWSSCQKYIHKSDNMITTQDDVYLGFGHNDQERINNYKSWLMEGEDSSFSSLNTPVGDELFRKKLLRKQGRIITIQKRGRPRKRG